MRYLIDLQAFVGRIDIQAVNGQTEYLPANGHAVISPVGSCPLPGGSFVLNGGLTAVWGPIP
jgi:hypothetical protein